MQSDSESKLPQLFLLLCFIHALAIWLLHAQEMLVGMPWFYWVWPAWAPAYLSVKQKQTTRRGFTGVWVAIAGGILWLMPFIRMFTDLALGQGARM